MSEKLDQQENIIDKDQEIERLQDIVEAYELGFKINSSANIVRQQVLERARLCIQKQKKEIEKKDKQLNIMARGIGVILGICFLVVIYLYKTES